MRNIWKGIVGAAMFCMALGSAHAEEKTITVGTLGWDDMTSITGVTKTVLENAGYKVKVVAFSDWGIAFAALAHGDVQIMTALPDYTTHDYWQKNMSKLEKLSAVSYGLYQAIVVPKYVPIDSVEQLNGIADKVDNKIIGIEAGSGIMREAQAAVKEYGLKLKLIEGSTAAMVAATKAAVDRKEWIAVTLWEPSWMMTKFDMKFLNDPKGVFPPKEAYYWIAQKGFSVDHPNARELIAGVFLPLQEMSAIHARVSDGLTMEQAVKEWTDKHPDLLKRWENLKTE
ncbi:glycine betaine ABC transporter substrate-binding protein [Mesorhizobium sp. Cs1299R1N1]|uniref:glycine betaine ABC transporter substrate-binding protein n=1 Tax=Mesorhizobium sp. Cs1299R1N1 TaxID=3015172 RepID=UPI00301B8585